MTQPLKKRILLAIPTITSYHTFLKELMESLVIQGWDTHLACALEPIRGFDCYKEAVAGKTHHIDFPRGANPKRHLLAALQLRKLVKEICPQLIHCHFGVTSFTAALARRPSWPFTIATIQGLTFPQTHGLRKWVFGACEYWSQRQMDGTWVLTQCDVDAFASLGVQNKMFLQSSKGFGCRLDLFDRSRYGKDGLQALRRSLGIKQDDFVFIFIGRQVQFKGFAVAVRAFTNIANEYSQVKLLLVGERDPLHPTGLCAAEEKYLRSSQNIVHVGWVNDVAKYLAISDANVFPSKREGMPVNLMESLAMGVPVITSNSRGCRDVIRNDIDGLLILELTERAFEAAMRRLLGDGSLRSRLAENALAGRARFDRRAWIKEQIEIYDRFLNR